MNVMDPFTFELLSRPSLPGFFGPFSGGRGGGAAPETETLDLEMGELDAYLRAIGVLPPLPPADFDHIPYSTPVNHAAALDGHLVQPVVEVPVPPKLLERTLPVSDVAASKKCTTRPRLCSEYDADIDKNLKATENDVEEPPLPDYLKTVQRDQMSPLTRASLVIWMEEFARSYDLPPGTLHSAVAYVDRVLSARTLTRIDYELRLLGAAAVFTAAKYEDQRTRLKLNAAEIAWYCWFATSEEVLDMERNMVAALGYRLGGPTAHTFVGHFTRYYGQGEDDLQVQRLAHQLADQSLLNYACLSYLPSAVAASAIFLARLALNPPDVLPWSAELQELTGYDTLDLSGCVRAMYSFSQSLICNRRC